jgi:murein DD-endopeptidase MepM/ murein hydrolase activator NlpD
MTKRFFSLIIVPHHRGKSKTITISQKKVKILLGIFAFLFLCLSALVVDYSLMSGTRQKYKKLRAENEVQKETVVQLKASMDKLKAAVENYESYASRINLMFGIKSPEVLREVGVGGGERANSQEPDLSSDSQQVTLLQAENISLKAEGIERSLSTLVRFLEDKKTELASTPSIYPTTGWTTSPFGERTDPFTGKRAFHYGIDIASGYGNPVVATADGTILELKREREDKIGGNSITIVHGMSGYTTIYCHLSRFNVKVGQKIKRGDVIGFVGNTGKALGPHVHYEVHFNGKPRDPRIYILEE